MSHPPTCDQCGTLHVYCDVRYRAEGRIYTLTLCKQHSDELWEQLNPLLKANRATYRIAPPTTLKEAAA